ncbi:unnamed protein product [Urochloa humidicola]
MNDLAAGFDAALAPLMTGLTTKLPGMAYSLADSFRLTEDAFADPAASGYTNVAGACGGGGRLAVGADCLPGSMLCADRGGYLFLDWVHPSSGQPCSPPRHFTMARPVSPRPWPISFKQQAHKI